LLARSARHVLPWFGTGTWSQRVARRMATNGVSDICMRLPFRTEIAPLIAGSDVVVFPALEPHFPRPAIEAAALARPVVASDLPGIDEVVLHDRTGLLVAAGDAVALAGAIRRLLLDRELAAALGREGRRHAERRFSLTAQMARIASIYESLLARPTPANA
ncbi:MAG TPA: glycosyltransferase, partial [Longimicrobiales bacterium]|nr:glycosyltransferase [Longimicrobiales bacterium]